MFLGAQLRLAAKKKFGAVEGQLKLAAPLLLNPPDHAVAPAPRGALGLGANYQQADNSGTSAAGVFVKQAFLRFDTLRLGRFEFARRGHRCAGFLTTLLHAAPRANVASRFLAKSRQRGTRAAGVANERSVSRPSVPVYRTLTRQARRATRRSLLTIVTYCHGRRHPWPTMTF